MSITKSTYQRAKSADKEPTRDERNCAAYGCPCRATISLTGAWMCISHAFAEPEDWQTITGKLKDLSWLLAFITDMQVMERKHEDWRGFAQQFWKGIDDHCIPGPNESATVYQNRMRQELTHRIGQSAKRPQVRQPAPVKPAGQFAKGVAL